MRAAASDGGRRHCAIYEVRNVVAARNSVYYSNFLVVCVQFWENGMKRQFTGAAQDDQMVVSGV